MILRTTNDRTHDIDMGEANGSASPAWLRGNIVTGQSGRVERRRKSKNENNRRVRAEKRDAG